MIAPPARMAGRSDEEEFRMPDARLLGPALCLTGSTLLALPAALPLAINNLGLNGRTLSLGGLVLAMLGLALALQGWRERLASASFHGRAALRQMTGRSAGRGPAKRVKIRIRCAR
ncbi:MAG TPA: hypothetical protein VNZ61_26360 [Roseomonas sp.]|nr:hypothetical protein [Roseomonas sp.]